MVLGVALALVYGIAHLLGGGSGSTDGAATPVGASVGTSGDPSGTPSPATPTPTSYDGRPDAVTTSRVATTGGQGSGKGHRATASVAPSDLAVPTGPCASSDVSVDPLVEGPAYAGHSVVFTMSMTSRVSPACTFVVSPTSVVVRVTSGSDRIWSTQECSGAVPKQSVVVRRDVPATVSVAWNGQRSDADCTRATAWAEPGYYHVTAAVFGAAPTDQQFQLASPPRPTVTKTPKPSKGAGPKPSPSSTEPSASPSRKH
jgi:hypothetical protein